MADRAPEQVCEDLLVLTGYFASGEAEVLDGNKPAKRKHPLCKAIVALDTACKANDFPAVGQAIRDVRSAWKANTHIGGKKKSAVREKSTLLFQEAQSMKEFEY